MGVPDEDLGALRLNELVGLATQDEDLLGPHPFDESLRKVAQRHALLREHPPGGFLGDGANIGEVDQPRTLLGAEPAILPVDPQLGVDGAVLQPGDLAQGLEDSVIVVPRENPVRIGGADQVVRVVDGPGLHDGQAHQELGQDVQALSGDADQVKFALQGGVYQHRTLLKLHRVQGDHSALRDPIEAMARTADALHQLRDGFGGTDLHHQVDGSYVDAQLQRGGGDYRLELASLEGSLDVQALLLAHRAMMRGHVLDAKLLQFHDQGLRGGPCVGEDERRLVLLHQTHQHLVHGRLGVLVGGLLQVVHGDEDL